MVEANGPDLTAKDLSAGYGDRDVISDLSIRIAPGDLVGVIGPNGSGKTTFIKALSRALKPSRGVVLLSGQDLYEMHAREVARQLAVVPQDTGATFAFTSLEVVLMGRNPHLGRLQAAGPRDIEIAREAMERANVWHLADRLVTELSGGEKQMVVIAQALAQSPRLLLLDEPTQHLDISHQLGILALLSEMCAAGLAVVVVIHDVNLAARYCLQLVMVRDGKEFARGTPEEVLTPANIMEVFGVDSVVTRQPVTAKPHVIFLSGSDRGGGTARCRVHLICGGGSGAALMRQMLERGFYVTSGVLNLGDGDEEVGRALEIQMALEAPFSRISDGAQLANRELSRAADVVVVSNVQFGPGNVANLDTAREALARGHRVLLFSPTPIGERDFTGGEASAVYEELRSAGAVELTDRDALLDAIHPTGARDEQL